MIMQLQQGDVNIVKTSRRPEKLKEVDNGVIREGEATGHAHKIVGTDFKLFNVVGMAGVLFAEIESEDCMVVHEEHKTVELPVGDYMFSPTVEYDHFAGRSRMVRD